MYLDFDFKQRSHCLFSTYCRLIIFVVCLLSFSLTLYGEGHDGILTLAEAESLALQAEPGREALLANADAYQELSISAGELPDPKLRAGIANFPFEAPSFTREPMTQLQFGLRQSFPAGNTRLLDNEKFKIHALEQVQKAENRELEIIYSVRMSWLDIHYWQRNQIIIEKMRPYFNDLLTVTTDLYSVGIKDQQDILRAELELSKLDDRLLEINKKITQAQGQLSRWIKNDAYRTLDSELPNWSPLPSLDNLQANLTLHPMLAAATTRIDVQNKNIDIAKESYKPAWAIDLGYAYRDGVLPTGASRSDFVSLGVTVDLPLFKRNRQDRKLAAAVSQRRAAAESHEELSRYLHSQLATEYVRWEILNQRIALYKDQLIVQTDSQAELALQAYQNNTADFSEVMRSYIARLNMQIDYERLQIERAKSYALLTKLSGVEQ